MLLMFFPSLFVFFFYAFSCSPNTTLVQYGKFNPLFFFISGKFEKNKTLEHIAGFRGGSKTVEGTSKHLKKDPK